jgi:CheY-like chemotaxis protein
MENPIRVLLVDDEERFVLNLAKLLRGRGFVVATAFSGAEGLACAEREAAVDVVLLDVKMPGMDGIETLRRLKQIAPEVEVLMLTGHADLDIGIEAMREGALDYLMKPCDIEDLVEKLREARELEGIKRRPVLWPRRLVKEITSPSFVRLEPGDLLEKALAVFAREAGMTARDELYILDADNRFQGVVTRRDIIAAVHRHHPQPAITWADLLRHPDWLPPLPLERVMRPAHPAATHPEADLAEAARCMVENNVHCMPVIADGKVTGILRLCDVLQHLAR